MSLNRSPDETAASQTSGFARYWTADAISSFGTAVTAVAVPVLMVQQLRAPAALVGLVGAAQLLPYAVLGLFAGVFVDRWSRRRVLLWSSVGRAVTLGMVPTLWLFDRLQSWMLIGVLIAFGSCSVFGFAATQSILPSLVARDRLVNANARLDQTDAAAQTIGPALGGALVAVVGAPLAILVDAVSYVIEVMLVRGIRVPEPERSQTHEPLLSQVRDGLRWMYRHPILSRIALSTHVWFLANGAAMVAFSLLGLRSLGLGAETFAALLACNGFGSLVGAGMAANMGRRFGSGRIVVGSRTAYPVGWSLALLAASGWQGPVILFVAMTTIGIVAGLENSNEMAIWQSATPNELLGRVNASRRSVNRTLGAIGAASAGVTVSLHGMQATLIAVIVVFGVAAAVVRPVAKVRL